ncbi:MAG: phenylalanine--tRNA ligase subunit beta [Gammaproteobacteria bacterium]|nr:MAG: phenylalanine--tRNA ligase subunit beta [Gammaproteobacteria bacterium]
MKFSENWLRELVEIPVGLDDLAHRLTMSGLEVESIERLGTQLDGIVVAEILAAERHPDADKLKVCRVFAGGETLQIVCGAPNARVGLKAPLAMVGSTVGTITIKPAKLRGIESNGMLCSGKELGLDADFDGLFELASDAVVGQSLADHLGLPDAEIEIGLTPNRSDCLGMHGLAREVSAQLGSRLQLKDPPVITATHAGMLAVDVQSPADCPRFCGRLLRGVDARARSPRWLSDRLRRAGVRPISAVVDITSYVMLELGQPMHAYDAATLQGAICVRRATPGESLTLLDERTVTLDPEYLVIADSQQAIGLAGIMGGHATRFTLDSRDVYLEAAHFVPASISGRARKLGMHTDASHRFERGVDPQLPRKAIERATALILQIAGGEAGPISETQAIQHLPPVRSVNLRRQRLQRVLGVAIDDADVARILGGLGMQVETHVDGWTAMPPSSRFDIAIEEDLIEEVARIHGYSKIPEQMPRGEISAARQPEGRIATSRMRDHLASRDYVEAINYAFTDRTLLAKWSLAEGGIALANPLSAELAVMRTSLLPGLVAALDANHKRQQSRVRLFEVGRSYHASADGTREIERIAGVACGDAMAEQWSDARRALDYFDQKGDVESLLALSGAGIHEFRFESGGPAFLHPGRGATIWRGDCQVGVLGALHPRLLKALDVDAEVHVFELDLERISQRSLPICGELSRFPSLRRDIAMVLSDQVRFAQIEAVVRRALGDRLVELVLFDRYSDKNLGIGVSSLAMGLILQDRSRTLSDQDADHCVELAVSALATEFAARLRG